MARSNVAAITCLLSSLSLSSNIAQADPDFFVGNSFTHPVPGGGSGPRMVVLREGSFTLGGAAGGDQAEALVVKISRPFAISATEITVGQYRRFLRATGSPYLADLDGQKDDLPVAGISWDEAESYVAWLSHHSGHHYQLPSSTQWEYAARAGSKRLYSWGGEVGKGRANCLDCVVKFNGELAPVGSFEPNNWGIHDVHGNVWEWTRDCVDPNSKPPLNGMPQLFGNCDLRELRGGSAQSDAWSIRTNTRAFAERKAQVGDVGMRVVMEIPQSD